MKNDNFVLKEDEEYLDFEADEKVANEIDEMLDFTILPDHAPSKSDEFKKLVDEKASNSETITEIDANNKEIITYKPSIKDFNIKNVKTKKLVHKAMVYTIIFMLAIFELFVANTGSVLSGLKIYAADNKPIRIVQNDKYGYIDLNGEKLISPKYTYGENFIKDYAIVKNTSNLPLIIDKGGKEVVPTGTYFSIYRAESNIIASKATKSGLKYGVLTSTLKTLVPFKYDNISYVGKGYSFTRNDVVGIINEMGKEVYTVKTTNKDNKIIEVFPSEVSSNKYERYAVVKVNSSSVVINLNDGTEVSKPTLNLVTAEKNNVFYETQNNNKKYFYVQNNKVLLESEDYASLTIDSIETGVLKALTKNYSYEFISTKSLEQFEKKLLIENTYYGENVFIYSNYKNHKTNYNLVKGGEVLNTIDYIKKVESSFKNGYAIVRLNDD
ncbi:MAG: WG repeat-containing protein, partial [Bacilli bacterium]